jgi:UDP-N-acetylglucosamine 1-carboxyvinyltransferase
MSAFVINGGRRISGSIRVQGSKNSVLPILASTILVEGVSVIHNCPDLSDTAGTVKILKNLGCKVLREGNSIIVDSTNVTSSEIPENLMREMRSSVIFLGAILGRMKTAVISTPGGCEIGLRPIDLHIYAMKQLGVDIAEDYGKLVCTASNGLVGKKITFSFPSVGATENAILASVTANGITTIVNAAREPEIIDLCDFLNKCGGEIYGAGESVITIKGKEKLNPCEYSVICDRIACATYLIAGAVTGGDIVLENTNPVHLNAIIPPLEEAGCHINVRCREIRLKAPRRLNRIDKIITQPYPGFPTDAQAPFTTLLCVAKGNSVIVENIFESRYKHVGELARLGAKIKVEGKVAVVEGVPKFSGAPVTAQELRGGAALAVAGLAAQGETQVLHPEYIDRGYERFEENLRRLGAEIYRV